MLAQILCRSVATIFICLNVFASDSNKIEKGSEKSKARSTDFIKTMKMGRGAVSFNYHTCWTADDSHGENSESMRYMPAQGCKSERKTWSLSINFSVDPGKASNFGEFGPKETPPKIDLKKIEEQKKEFGAFETDIVVDGKNAKLLGDLLLESQTPSVNKTFQNAKWIIRFDCRGAKVEAVFKDHASDEEIKLARTNRSLPPIFQEFVNGIKCDEKNAK